VNRGRRGVRPWPRSRHSTAPWHELSWARDFHGVDPGKARRRGAGVAARRRVAPPLAAALARAQPQSRVRADAERAWHERAQAQTPSSYSSRSGVIGITNRLMTVKSFFNCE